MGGQDLEFLLVLGNLGLSSYGVVTWTENGQFTMEWFLFGN